MKIYISKSLPRCSDPRAGRLRGLPEAEKLEGDDYSVSSNGK
jgi:hypothetical protein